MNRQPTGCGTSNSVPCYGGEDQSRLARRAFLAEHFLALPNRLLQSEGLECGIGAAYATPATTVSPLGLGLAENVSKSTENLMSCAGQWVISVPWAQLTEQWHVVSHEACFLSSAVSELGQPLLVATLALTEDTNPSEYINALQPIARQENPREIELFLARHPETQPIMEEASGRIISFFGDGELSIRLEHDPESAEDFQSLVFTLRTNLEPEAALELLYKFYDEWCLGAIDRAKGRIVLTFEYL